MCGLIHLKRFDGLPARKMITKRYEQQKDRGTEGFGFVSLQKGVVNDYFRHEEEKPLFDRLKSSRASEILLHHRKPTSTPNLWECAQPLYITIPGLKYEYVVAHNGVIRNAETLRADHDKKGYAYTTDIIQQWKTKWDTVHETLRKFNDSEAFAIELALALDDEGKGISAVEGTIAFIAIQLEKETNKAKKLFWGRNYGNPLVFENTDRFFQISSVGKGKEVKAHLLCSYDYEDNKLRERDFTIGITTYYSYSSTYYSDYYKPTPKEEKEEKKNYAKLDPGEGIPYPTATMDDEIILGHLLEMESERNSIAAMFHTVFDGEMNTYLVERSALLDDRIKTANTLLGIKAITAQA